MRRFFHPFVVLSFLILAVLTYLNCGLYYKPTYQKIDGVEINSSLLAQLRFLRETISQGADKDMQKIYPEGYVFMNALYGLTWCEFAKNLKSHSALYDEAHFEIQTAFQKIDSEEGRRIFDEDLSLPLGAFYNGWTNYLLGKKLMIENPQERDTKEIAVFKNTCAKIASTIQGASGPYLESYRHAVWPADGVVCLASLALHDQLFDPLYQDVLSKWLIKVKASLDSNGLVPHETNFRSGKVEEAARGSSQSLILCFLLDINPSFAFDQFKIYKKLFLDKRLGLPGIREYPIGTYGIGDVDSGPVIFQMGAAASIVGLRTMTLHNEPSLAVAMRNGIETFGIPTNKGEGKRYLFGQLPMADAFIAWSHSAANKKENLSVDSNWRIQFQLYSGLVGIILIGLTVLTLKKSKS